MRIGNRTRKKGWTFEGKSEPIFSRYVENVTFRKTYKNEDDMLIAVILISSNSGEASLVV